MFGEIAEQKRIDFTDLPVDIDLDPCGRRLGHRGAAKCEEQCFQKRTSTVRPSKVTGRVSSPRRTTSFRAGASIFDPRASRSASVFLAPFQLIAIPIHSPRL